MNTRIVANSKAKNHFAELKPKIKSKLLSDIRIELLKLHVDFSDLDPVNKVSFQEIIPIQNLTDKIYLQEKIKAVAVAALYYRDMLLADIKKTLPERYAIKITGGKDTTFNDTNIKGYDTAISIEGGEGTQFRNLKIKK